MYRLRSLCLASLSGVHSASRHGASGLLRPLRSHTQAQARLPTASLQRLAVPLSRALHIAPLIPRSSVGAGRRGFSSVAGDEDEPVGVDEDGMAEDDEAEAGGASAGHKYDIPVAYREDDPRFEVERTAQEFRDYVYSKEEIRDMLKELSSTPDSLLDYKYNVFADRNRDTEDLEDLDALLMQEIVKPDAEFSSSPMVAEMKLDEVDVDFEAEQLAEGEGEAEPELDPEARAALEGRGKWISVPLKDQKEIDEETEEGSERFRTYQEEDPDIENDFEQWEQEDLEEEEMDWDALFNDFYSPLGMELRCNEETQKLLNELYAQNLDALNARERKARASREKVKDEDEELERIPDEDEEIEEKYRDDGFYEIEHEDGSVEKVPNDPYSIRDPNEGEWDEEPEVLNTGPDDLHYGKDLLPSRVSRPEDEYYEQYDMKSHHNPRHTSMRTADELPFVSEPDPRYRHDDFDEDLLHSRVDINVAPEVTAGAIEPWLTDMSQETMYHLNSIDPVKWDHREIAKTWGVSVPRVRAIIRLKALEQHRRARGTLFDEEQDDSGTSTLTWDYVGHPFHYQDLKEVPAGDFESIKIREDDERYWQKLLRWKLPPRDSKLPQPDAKPLSVPKTKKDRFKFVLTDMTTKGENLSVIVRDEDGTLRNPTKKELIRAIQIENPWHQDRLHTIQSYW